MKPAQRGLRGFIEEWEWVPLAGQPFHQSGYTNFNRAAKTGVAMPPETKRELEEFFRKLSDPQDLNEAMLSVATERAVKESMSKLTFLFELRAAIATVPIEPFVLPWES